VSSSVGTKDSEGSLGTLQTTPEVSKELGEYHWTIMVLLDFHGEKGVRCGSRRLIDRGTKERLRGYLKTYRDNRLRARGA